MQAHDNNFGGIDLGLSLSEFDASLNSVEFKELLITSLGPVLEQRFPGISGKQKIKSYSDRISFACPICGDSMKNNYKKRGNFILKGKFINFFKCHNCFAFMRIDDFFKEYGVTLNLDAINYIGDTIQDFSINKNLDSSGDISLFFDMATIEDLSIDRNYLIERFGLVEAENSSIWDWLKNRLQFDRNKFLYNEKENYLLILNLTPSGKVLGIQKRLFDDSDNKYMTYRLSKLHEKIKSNKKIPDEIDKLSQIFNICLISYSRPITIFEGPLDSFLFRNSLGNTGVDKHLPFEFPVRYWNDDDKTGRNKSLQLINGGKSVFLWTRLKSQLELPHRRKWDLNDLMIYLKKNNKPVPNFELFFSDDPLDAIDI